MARKKKGRRKETRGTIPKKRGEEWRLIEGTEDFYISNLGRFRHKKRLPKYAINADGYYTCNIGRKKLLVHRLVAAAFCPNPYDKPCVDHIDGDKLNNLATNLRWVTVAENTQAAFELGLMKTVDHRYPCLCVNEETHEGYIYKFQTDAAKDLGLDPKLVNRCATGRLPSYKGYKFMKINTIEDRRQLKEGDECGKLIFVIKEIVPKRKYVKKVLVDQPDIVLPPDEEELNKIKERTKKTKKKKRKNAVRKNRNKRRAVRKSNAEIALDFDPDFDLYPIQD